MALQCKVHEYIVLHFAHAVVIGYNANGHSATFYSRVAQSVRRSQLDWLIRHTVIVSQCHSDPVSRSSDVMWSISISALFARKLTSDHDLSCFIYDLKNMPKLQKRETFIWTKILSVTMVGVVYKIHMVVSSAYSEVELLNFHIQSL